MKHVMVYSTTTCPYCHMLSSWLKKRGIDFTEYMVDQNPIAAQNMIRLSGQMSVPFTVIEDGEAVVDQFVGFDAGLLNKVLQIN